MSFLEIFFLSLSVSVDALAVSVAGALCDRSKNRWQNALLAALFFGGFQFLMPLAGYGTATLFASFVKAVDHYLALLLLLYVGGNMIFEACRKKEETPDVCCGLERFFTPKRLFVPAIATSLDALAVGAGLRFAGKSILFPAAGMGIITGVICIAGVLLGGRIGKLAGEKTMTIAGGCAIILIGVKIFLQDTGIL
jgi:putative Mn2+ efflux pump MntP